MSNFENATTYTGRFIGDADAVLEVRVIKRTAKTVTYVHPHTGDEQRAKIHNNDDGEFFFPMGQYSMAPVIRADRPAAQNDFTLKATTKGTALIAQTDAARAWIAETFKMLADPVLDDTGIELARGMIERAGMKVAA